MAIEERGEFSIPEPYCRAWPEREAYSAGYSHGMEHHALREAELLAEIERLRSLANELIDNKGRLQTMEEDHQPGLPERRLADDLLDAIEAFEAAEAAEGKP